MRTPRGFRKRYFTLAAIQAMVCQCKLRSLVSRVIMMGLLVGGMRGGDEDEELLEDPPDLLLSSLAVVSSISSYQGSLRPCSCNRVFAGRAYCALFLSSFLRKLSPCRKTKSGLSPPFSSLFSLMYHQITIKG